jgi:hypothetical protein
MMKAQRISMLAVAALATTTLAVATSPAHGGVQTVKNYVTVGMDYGGFAHGRVFSDKIACMRNREARFYIRRPDADWRLLFTTTTHGDHGDPGFWSQSVDVRLPVKYYAVIRRERNGGYLCMRDESSVRRQSCPPCDRSARRGPGPDTSGGAAARLDTGTDTRVGVGAYR